MIVYICRKLNAPCCKLLETAKKQTDHCNVLSNSITDTLAQFSNWIFRYAGAVGRLVGACRLLAFESIWYIYIFDLE